MMIVVGAPDNVCSTKCQHTMQTMRIRGTVVVVVFVEIWKCLWAIRARNRMKIYTNTHEREKNTQPKKERDRMGVFVVGIKCMRWYTALIWILYIEHVMTIEIGMGEFSTLVVLVALRSARRKFYLFLCLCLPTKTRHFFIFNFFPVFFFFGRLLHGRISRL